MEADRAQWHWHPGARVDSPKSMSMGRLQRGVSNGMSGMRNLTLYLASLSERALTHLPFELGKAYEDTRIEKQASAVIYPMIKFRPTSVEPR